MRWGLGSGLGSRSGSGSVVRVRVRLGVRVRVRVRTRARTGARARARARAIRARNIRARARCKAGARLEHAQGASLLLDLAGHRGQLLLDARHGGGRVVAEYQLEPVQGEARRGVSIADLYLGSTWGLLVWGPSSVCGSRRRVLDLLQDVRHSLAQDALGLGLGLRLGLGLGL